MAMFLPCHCMALPDGKYFEYQRVWDERSSGSSYYILRKKRVAGTIRSPHPKLILSCSSVADINIRFVYAYLTRGNRGTVKQSNEAVGKTHNECYTTSQKDHAFWQFNGGARGVPRGQPNGNGSACAVATYANTNNAVIPFLMIVIRLQKLGAQTFYEIHGGRDETYAWHGLTRRVARLFGAAVFSLLERLPRPRDVGMIVSTRDKDQCVRPRLSCTAGRQYGVGCLDIYVRFAGPIGRWSTYHSCELGPFPDCLMGLDADSKYFRNEMVPTFCL
jgi:hypothetical protein